MGHIQYRQKQAPQWAEGKQAPTDDAGDGESAFVHGVFESSWSTAVLSNSISSASMNS